MKRLVKCLILLAILIGCVEAQAEVVRCSVCGRDIIGSYRVCDGKAYCLEDYERSRPVCKRCGQKIIDRYFEYKNGTLCPNCYEQMRPRCYVCGQTLLGEYVILDGHNLCPSCSKSRLPKCTACGKAVSGKYVKYEDDTVACSICANNKRLPHCVTCGAPVKNVKGNLLRGAGGYACAKHYPLAITTDAKAAALLKSVYKQILYSLGNTMKLRCTRLDVKLVNLEELQNLYKEKSPHMRGFCQSQCSLISKSHTIYLLSGMNESLMRRVIAHELGHAWQFENNKRINSCSSRFKEGFAEWCSYKNTQVYGKKQQLENILNNQAASAYSEGLRDYLEYEKKVGKNGVLKAAAERTLL